MAVYTVEETGEDSLAQNEEFTALNVAIEGNKRNREINNNLSVICNCCGNEIPKERLEFVPSAKYCVKCQGERDKNPLYSHKVYGGGIQKEVIPDSDDEEDSEDIDIIVKSAVLSKED